MNRCAGRCRPPGGPSLKHAHDLLSRVVRGESRSEALRWVEISLEPRLKSAHGERIDKTMTRILADTWRNEA